MNSKLIKYLAFAVIIFIVSLIINFTEDESDEPIILDRFGNVKN
tara:strand:- start:284 stop:415 length:132 start_codon:yes stop_codon:yes gene_type:complete